MKKISLSFMFVLAAWSFQACNNSDNTKTDGAESTTQSDDSKMSGDSKMSDSSSAMNTTPAETGMQDDSKFMVEAASGGMMEVELGQMALQKAQNKKVKDFGAMMVKDHGKANAELKTLAAAKNVSLPAALTEEHQKHVSEMREKTGADFDKAYASMMVDDHQKDISKFEDASNKGTDADVKAFAAKTLPVLRKHLETAKAMNDGLK